MFHHSIYEELQEIAYQSYKKQKELYEEYSKMSCEDYRLSCPEAGDDAYAAYTHSTLIAILFEAMAVEAYINWYGSKNLGQDAYKYFEKHETQEKILGIVKLTTGVDISTEAVYQKVCYLLAMRNTLMHNNQTLISFSGEMTGETVCDTAFKKAFCDGQKHYYDALETVRDSTVKLRLLIQSLESHDRNILLAKIRNEEGSIVLVDEAGYAIP